MWAVFEYSFQSKSLLCRYLPLLNTKKEKNTKYGSESFVSNAVRSAQLESEKHSRATRIARRYKFILCLSCKFIFNMLRIYERRFQRLWRSDFNRSLICEA